MRNWKILLTVTILLWLIVCATAFGQKAELVVQTGHASEIGSVAFSSDGKVLASNSSMISNSTKLWNITTGKEIRTVAGDNPVFSPDGKTLSTQYTDMNTGIQSIKLWNWQTGQEVKTILAEAYIRDSVTFSPKGEILAVVPFYNNNNLIKLFDFTTGDELRTLAGHTGSIVSISFSPDGKSVVN